MKKSGIRAMISNDFLGTAIIAFLAIFAIPMICSLIVLNQNENNVKEEIINSDKVVINTISGYLDKEVSSAETIASSVIRSAYFRHMASYDTTNYKNADFVAAVYDFSRELKEYVAIYPTVEDLYVYFVNTDLTVSSTTFDPGKSFFEKYYSGVDFEYSDWKSIIDSDIYEDIAVVEDSYGRHIDLFINPLHFNKTDMQVKVVVRLSDRQLADYVSKIYAFNNKELMVISRDDTVIFRTGENLLPVITYDVLSNFVDFREERDYMYTSIKSANTGWKYVLCTGDDLVADRVQYTGYIVTINIIIYMLMTVLFLTIFIIKNYLPIKKIVHMVNGDIDINYKFLENIVSEYNTYKSYADKYRRRYNEVQKNKFFNNLVSVEREANTVLKEAKSIDVRFISDMFVLMIIDVYNYEAMFEGEDIDDAERESSAEFIIKNIFEELLGKMGQAYIIPKNDRYVCVLNLKQDSDNRKSEIRELLRYGKNVVEKQFDIFMTVNVTDMYRGVENIHNAYTAANEMYKKSRFIKNAEIVFFDELQGSSSDKLFDNKFSERLAYFVQSGDERAVVGMIDNILSSFTGNLMDSSNGFKIYTIKTVDSLASMLADEYASGAEFYGYVNKILEFESYDRCIEGFRELVAYVCRCVQNVGSKLDDEADSSDMLKKIKNCVAQKYTDSSITVAYIGECVGVTPYYASRVFKEETGENLSDYISRYRIEKAKEILASDDTVSVSRLYELVGFGSERTFMRMFNKYENITISQYKKILKSDN